MVKEGNAFGRTQKPRDMAMHGSPLELEASDPMVILSCDE